MSRLKKNKNMDPAREMERRIRRRTIVSFTVFFVLIFAAYQSWNHLLDMPQREGSGVRLLPRKALEVNHSIFSHLFSNDHLAKSFPKSMAVKQVRVNGAAGLRNAEDTSNWHLHLVRANGDTVLIGMDEIKRLPKTEIVFDFKCIEGWDQVTHWGGVRMADFVKYYHLDREKAFQYVGLATPDRGYYVGLDMASALHPQTLLCYEMNGKPLPLNQGYPLRLIIPVKYGVKSLKRIGTMYFSDSRPPDFWAERGYDYYTGL